MDKLIENIHRTLSDYRKDEGVKMFQVTQRGIKNWVNQFEVEHRLPILTELDRIFKQRYCSKDHIKKFLSTVVKKLSSDFGYTSPKEFLLNTNFLDLQESGKSQKIMLKLLDNLLDEEYGISLEQCGVLSKTNSVYIDDILCTGLTLITDVTAWAQGEFVKGKSNGKAVEDGSTRLIFAYVFIHEKNYQKKRAEMKHKISKAISVSHHMYRLQEIENGLEPTSKMNLILPKVEGQSQSVLDYKAKIIGDVDEYTQKYKKISPEEFFRPDNLPMSEEFFTSADNRHIIETAFLNKGIEILKNANVKNDNIRALGYSIPSFKNFGFGALCFTWRNVPNNTPLVFWYSGGGFTPLFHVHRGGW